MRFLLLLMTMLPVACATACVHPVAATWRLSNNVLVPPGVSRARESQRTVKAEAAKQAVCPQGARSNRNQVSIRVRQSLSSRTPGWLTAWTQDLEAQGCIAPGEAFRLATAITQSLPLETNAAFRLLYPSDPNVVEIDPRVRLRVMTLIMAEGAAPDAPLIEATATVKGNTVTIEGRFTENVLGYEMT